VREFVSRGDLKVTLRVYGSIISSLAAVAMIAIALAPASAQEGASKGKGKGKAARGYQPPDGPAPKNPWGKPDFSGLWQRPYVPDMTKSSKNGDQIGEPNLPFTDWGKAEWEKYDAVNGDYTGACLPFGLVRSMNSPDPIQIMQSDKYLSLLYEQNTWFKVIPIDGRPHRDIVPTWFGDSVGKWEGDTLVVDTINFNGKSRLDTIGHPHSDQLHVVEHFSRPDLGHMSYQIQIDDPKTFTKPWTNTRRFTLRTDWEIMEYSCEENNKSFWEGRIKIPENAR
jgi:hypothetical protein